MAKTKYDYDGDEFYRIIEDSANRQMLENNIFLDKYIAEDLGVTHQTFSDMKRGEYRMWDEDENRRRKQRINEILTRAREAAEPLVWKTILEMGLGKVQGQDITFEKVNGQVSDAQRITVHKLPPNLNALTVWLRHHSKRWRDIESGIESNDVPQNISKGIDIESWINKQVE